MSNERDMAYITGYGKPHPMIVIRDNADGVPSADGDRRADAFVQLREPLQHGGNAQDQEAYLKILSTAAKTDSNPRCRMVAIRALGKYKDSRAARALEDIYQQQKLPFTQDNNAAIRREALVALEQSHNEDSLRLLIQVARQPGPPTTADLEDRNQTAAEKIVAIRALRHYRQEESVETLKYVLKTEKNVSLRARARESLDETTGKRWPEGLEAWQAAEVRPLPPGNDGVIQTVTGWLPKW